MEDKTLGKIFFYHTEIQRKQLKLSTNLTICKGNNRSRSNNAYQHNMYQMNSKKNQTTVLKQHTYRNTKM